MTPKYIIHRWPLGWSISSNGTDVGIPINALNETIRIFPKNAVLDSGINHHLTQSGWPDTIMTIATPKDSDAWRAQITERLKDLDPETRWWHGLDVGKSSAAIFSCFSQRHPGPAARFSNGSTPLDSSDLGRCIRLLDLFPEWKESLIRVATIYPDGLWPHIIHRWPELIAATPAQQTQILQSLHR